MYNTDVSLTTQTKRLAKLSEPQTGCALAPSDGTWSTKCKQPQHTDDLT